MAGAQAALPLLDSERGPGPRRARSALERATAEDLLHDYVLWPYDPLAPQEGKLRSINLLVESFALAGVEDEGLALVQRVREGLGPFRTVWGIKRHHGTSAVSWELYFYDWDRAHADLSVARLRDLLAPVCEVDAREPWPLPWHMVSIEIGPESLRARAKVPAHVYIDMRSYELAGDRFTFENVYTFHDPRADVDEVLHRLRSSVHFDPQRDRLAAVLPPALRRCGRVCVANKRRSDAVYASRIPTPALAWFLRTYGWPDPLGALVEQHRADLDHLLWDVGLDFDRESGSIEVRKTGIYGSF
jgi:hypothetical protein